MESKRLCFACDLKNEEAAIEKYKEYHRPENAWPEITASIKDAGILDMQIFLTGNRLFMIMEIDESFSSERKAAMDRENSKVQEWEVLMSTFQQAVPWVDPSQKWTPMELIFKIE